MTTLIGYARVSSIDGSQSTDLQVDALAEAGVAPEQVYQDQASGKRSDRPQLTACLKALRPGDTLVVWKLDRLGRDLRDLVNIVHGLTDRGIGFRVLTGQGASVDTTTAAGKMIFGIFAALAEYERELIRERTMAGLAAARARGRKGGRPYTMTTAKLRLAMAAMGQPETKVSDLCRELGITRQTLYRHVSPQGELRADGKKLIAARGRAQMADAAGPLTHSDVQPTSDGAEQPLGAPGSSEGNSQANGPGLLPDPRK